MDEQAVWDAWFDAARTRAKTIRARANAALAAVGQGPVAASYWAGSGWAVSDQKYAVPPLGIGDKEWDVFVPALPGERPSDFSNFSN